MSMGEKLRNCRLKLKKTLHEQSEILGVSVNTIYRWEHDLATPRKHTLKKIANFYEVPLDWLLQEGATENESELVSIAPSPDNEIEQELLKMFRALSFSNKYKILGYIERVCVEDMSESVG